MSPELIVSNGEPIEPKPGDMVLGTPHCSNHSNPTSNTPSPRPGDLVLGFTPSTYQKAIFEWLVEGQGSCVVSAVPGSGKTTLIKGANYIPKSLRSRFLAFNKHIAQQLDQKLPRHIKSSIIHSLGLSSICRRYRGLPEINQRKYSSLVSVPAPDRGRCRVGLMLVCQRAMSGRGRLFLPGFQASTGHLYPKCVKSQAALSTALWAGSPSRAS